MLFSKSQNREGMGAYLAWFGIWCFVTIVGACLTPERSGHGTHQQLHLPPCPSAMLLGRPCPGCGMTTGFSNMIHGSVNAAWEANPMAVIMYPLFTITAIGAFICWLKMTHFDTRSNVVGRVLMAVTAVYLGVSVIRFANPDPSYKFEQALMAKSQKLNKSN